MPAAATDASTTPIDVDGDGAGDDVTVYRDGEQWYLHASLSGSPGGQVRAPITSSAGPVQGMRLLGGAAIGGDGATVFVQVGAGASVALVGLFAVDGCTITQLTLPSGAAELPVGGTVTHQDGAACEDGGLVIRSATSPDGATYSATSTPVRREGTSLVPDGDPSTTTLAASDPTFAGIGSLRCAGVEPV